MTELTSFASIPTIMVVCWLFIDFYHWKFSNEEGKLEPKAESLISVLCGSVGMIIGIGTYYLAPEIIHSDNALAAAANGIASGLASVAFRKQKKAD